MTYKTGAATRPSEACAPTVACAPFDVSEMRRSEFDLTGYVRHAVDGRRDADRYKTPRLAPLTVRQNIQ